MSDCTTCAHIRMTKANEFTYRRSCFKRREKYGIDCYEAKTDTGGGE